MTSFLLRSNLWEFYRRSAQERVSTITAAPFYSLKTRTIRHLAETDQRFLLFDLRQGVDGFKLPKNAEQVFLDSVEIVPLPVLGELLKKIKRIGAIPHLLTHLYYYENCRDLLPQSRRAFPQLLSKEEINIIKKVFSSLPEQERKLGEDFVDYCEGWPAVVHLIGEGERFQLFKNFLALLAQKKINSPIDYFHRYSAAVTSFCLKDIRGLLGFIPADKRQFAVSSSDFSVYQQGRIDLKELAENAQADLWPLVKNGYFWLDEASGVFRVPSPLGGVENGS